MFRYSYPEEHNKIDQYFNFFIMNKFVIKIRKTLRAHSSKRHGIAKMQGEKQRLK